MADTARQPQLEGFSLIFSVAGIPSLRMLAARMAQMDSRRSKAPSPVPATRKLPASKNPKRKKGRCRRFLVSLAVRRRKSPISHLLGTKEIRHDAQMLGDSGVFLPFV